jgi:hypothetical protein
MAAAPKRVARTQPHHADSATDTTVSPRLESTPSAGQTRPASAAVRGEAARRSRKRQTLPVETVFARSWLLCNQPVAPPLPAQPPAARRAVEFRVVSYNVLCQEYVEPHFFPRVPDWLLSAEAR